TTRTCNGSTWPRLSRGLPVEDTLADDTARSFTIERPCSFHAPLEQSIHILANFLHRSRHEVGVVLAVSGRHIPRTDDVDPAVGSVVTNMPQEDECSYGTSLRNVHGVSTHCELTGLIGQDNAPKVGKEWLRILTGIGDEALLQVTGLGIEKKVSVKFGVYRSDRVIEVHGR